MGHTTKAIIIVAVILLAIGLIIAGIAFALGGYSLRALDKPSSFEEKTYNYDAKKVSSIDVSDVSRDVKVIGWDKDEIKIISYESKEEYYKVDLTRDGTLTVKYINKTKWFFNLNVGFGYDDMDTLTVYIPSKLHQAKADFNGDINVSTVSGNIEIDGINREKSTLLATTSGDIELSSITSNGNMSLTSISGNIDFERVNIVGDFRSSTTSGDLEIDSCDISGSFGFSAISGEVDLHRVSIGGDVSFNTTSGNIDFERLACENFRAESIGGDISGTIIGDPGDYRSAADSISGDINVPNYSDGKKLIDVNTTSGNINISLIKN